MLARNGERPDTDCTVNGARKVSGVGNARTFKLTTKKSQVPLRAELVGSIRCKVAGIVATGSAPVLTLCRQLLAAGLDPDRAMQVFRGATLALRVRSIGEGAALTVKSAGNGAPMFALDTANEGAARPPVRKNGGGAP